MTLIQFFLVASAALFVLMPLLAMHGHACARRRSHRDGNPNGRGASEIEATIFALFSLLMAFTFNTAYTRYDQNRQAVVEEVDAIWNAYLRMDLLSPADQQPIKARMRSYVEWRISFWRDLAQSSTWTVIARDSDASRDLERAALLKKEIWTMSVDASRSLATTNAQELVLDALGRMISTSANRLSALLAHPPLHIYAALFALALATAWFAGHAMVSMDRIANGHVIGFAAITSAMLYLTLDLEHPRLGLIRLNSTEALLGDLLKRM